MAALPEVRQQEDESSPMFGAVAVATPTPNRWGYMHPVHGGGWCTDADVATWTVFDFTG